jgi:hypothetical protein
VARTATDHPSGSASSGFFPLGLIGADDLWRTSIAKSLIVCGSWWHANGSFNTDHY